MGLNGKVAIVTGAGKGIGKATALELAKAGAKVVLAARSKADIEKLAGEIRAMGGTALAVPMDVSKWEDAQRLAQVTMDQFGRIDILVNNAGVAPKGPDGSRLKLLEIDEELWNTILNTNLKGYFHCTKAVVPAMMNQRAGKIVNLGSTTGLTGDISSAPYCAAKAGIMGFTKAVARELGSYNITANTVAPGLVITEMHALEAPAKLQKSVDRTPLARAGQPIDVARVILFMLADELFVTGQTIVVDGGKEMH